MRQRSRVASVLALLFVAALPALAGTVTLNGTIDSNSPIMPVVPLITTPNCTGTTTVFDVHYAAYPFEVSADGTYQFDEPGTSTALYVLTPTFDPASAVDTCIAATNTNPLSIPVVLTADTQYFAVLIDDTFAQSGLTYSLTISGPGSITVEYSSILAIPTLSVWSLALLAALLAAAGFLALRRLSA
ncbi:MAG: IPTL-CTERM sorting domain-containing protein [Thermoanaerobaculia bacterium]